MSGRIFRDGVDVTSEYNCWAGIRYRCSNPNSKIWKYYGGRGISVCKEWDDFDQFFADLGPKPSRLHSIDRKDNDGDYTPANCRWATKKEQGCNRRDNVLINGVTQKDHAIKLGLTPTCIRSRRKQGLDVFADRRFLQGGENQWMAGFTNQQVREMRAILAERGYYRGICSELSKQFGGTYEMVRKLLKGETYSCVK